ncbi:MAG TPA: hypothetical protein VGI10_13805 [Polyangiaceae bacterium]|jgi:hypothetical protein
MTRAGPPAPPTLKIVTQYWRGETRVCEFAKSDLLLDICISSSKDPVGEWCIEARNGRDSGARISERAATRTAALTAVASAWVERGPALGLPTLDWEVVRTALRTVGALD